MAISTQTVLVIENDRSSPPGRLLDWIRDADLEPVLIRAWDGEAVPTDPGSHRALVLLGGGFLPDADESHPWLAAERALLARAAGTVPVLGICLGGQLVAHTFGGRVEGEHGQPEKGVVELELLPAAEGDPVFGGLPGRVPAIESHVDQITELPPDAVLLASSECCRHQLLRVGDRVWGLQFHPEVDAARVRRWSTDRLAALGFDPAAVVAEAEARDDELRACWRGAVGAFLALAGEERPAPTAAPR